MTGCVHAVKVLTYSEYCELLCWQKPRAWSGFFVLVAPPYSKTLRIRQKQTDAMFAFKLSLLKILEKPYDSSGRRIHDVELRLQRVGVYYTRGEGRIYVATPAENKDVIALMRKLAPSSMKILKTGPERKKLHDRNWPTVFEDGAFSIYDMSDGPNRPCLRLEDVGREISQNLELDEAKKIRDVLAAWIKKVEKKS